MAQSAISKVPGTEMVTDMKPAAVEVSHGHVFIALGVLSAKRPQSSGEARIVLIIARFLLDHSPEMTVHKGQPQVRPTSRVSPPACSWSGPGPL